MTKPKKQSAAAQAFDRSTVKEVLNSQKTVEKEIALRAALAVMERAVEYEQNMGEVCPHCLDRNTANHNPQCPIISAIRLVRAALGE